ncbi:MAG: hypothetical protein E6H69_08915, partial [Betaproteobacteria bacterium]
MRSRCTYRVFDQKWKLPEYGFAQCAGSDICGKEKMSDRAPRRHSIRRRVLTFLIPSLLLLVLLGAWFSYFDAVNIAASSYDRSLLDPALDMAENVRIGA